MHLFLLCLTIIFHLFSWHFFFCKTNRVGAIQKQSNLSRPSFLLWRHFYSGFRPNECFIVCKSFLKIPVDHCSLYGKYYEYMFLFLIKCDSSIMPLCCSPTFSLTFRFIWDEGIFQYVFTKNMTTFDCRSNVRLLYCLVLWIFCTEIKHLS